MEREVERRGERRATTVAGSSPRAGDGARGGAEAAAAPPRLDVEAVRREFPILGREVYGKPLVYLDSAASAQTPRRVLDAVERTYRESYSNVHRGVHRLSVLATEAYEGARARVAEWIGAADPAEVVFVRGTTEAINLVAASYLRPRLGPGDEILITLLEHHSNIVPWQLAAAEKGARVVAAPIDDSGALDLEALAERIGERTRLLAVVHVSNALGVVNPVARIVELAHERGVPVLLDGAQAVPHLPVDVGRIGCDFYAFSGHKVFGPTGIGALWGRRELLGEMPPWQGGGEMIRSVGIEASTFKAPPARFEAGTPNFVGAVGLAAALDFLADLGVESVAAHEAELLDHAHRTLSAVPGLTILGTARPKVPVVSFVLDGVHAHDVGTILDREGIAVRAGHHCTQPLMERFGVAATARASLALYNTREEIDRLAAALERVREVFA